jgi:hypothetical protein
LPYFNFNYVTDPPNDETVNVETDLNDNFEELATKLDGFNKNPNTIVGPPVGTEALVSGNRVAVWDGTTWRLAFNQATSWTSWQTLTPKAPVGIQGGFTPKARVNPVIRCVQLTGILNYNAGAAWPTASDVDLFADTDIGPTYAPVPGGLAHCQVATSQVTGVNQAATANIRIQHITSGTARVGLFARFQGDAGGGNFVVLDKIEWWY